MRRSFGDRLLRAVVGAIVVVALVLGLIPRTERVAMAAGASYSFAYAHDVQRNPSFPKSGQMCDLYDRRDPITSLCGPLNINDHRGEPEGDWSLVFYANYKEVEGTDRVLDEVVGGVADAYGLESTDDVPIFELKLDGNHIALGVMFALTDGNEHALFLGDTFDNGRGAGAGYVLAKGEVAEEETIEVAKDLDDIKLEATADLYSVTLEGCENATPSGGSTSQTELSGPMTSVVYEADEGYYFPEDYAVDPQSGISVTRDGFGQITVSGTPTADVTLTLPPAVAKATPLAPNAKSTDCTTVSNNDGSIINVEAGMEYTPAGTDDWTDVTAEKIEGLAPGTYLVRYKETPTTLPSAAQELVVGPYVEPTDPASPTDPTDPAGPTSLRRAGACGGSLRRAHRPRVADGPDRPRVADGPDRPREPHRPHVADGPDRPLGKRRFALPADRRSRRDSGRAICGRDSAQDL